MGTFLKIIVKKICMNFSCKKNDSRGDHMKNLLIYYGYLSSFNSAVHQWVLEEVAVEMAKYDLLVFGDGVQNTTHQDYSNAQVIVPRIKALNPSAKIFGYVTLAQSYSDFKSKVDDWETLGADSIFIDEAGYDYGTKETNDRDAFNDKVDYVHGKNFYVFANAWNIDHILGQENDPSYPNDDWNANVAGSHLNTTDYVLLESFGIFGVGTYETHTQWHSRGSKLANYAHQFVAGSQIPNGDANGQTKFDFLYLSAASWNLHGVGSSDTNYGSGGAVKLWTRPSVLDAYNPPVKNVSANKYYAYRTGQNLLFDYTVTPPTVTKETL